MAPSIFTRTRKSRTPSAAKSSGSTPPAQVALALPSLLPATTTGSPCLPPLDSLPPLVVSTPSQPSTPPAAHHHHRHPPRAHDSPSSSSHESTTSLSHADSESVATSATTTTIGRATTSTRPSSVEDHDHDSPTPKASGVFFPTTARAQGQRERPRRVPVPQVDTPAALLAALDLDFDGGGGDAFPGLVTLAPPVPTVLPPSAQELVVMAQQAGPAASCARGGEEEELVEGCGCGAPAVEDDDEEVSDEEDADEAEDEEEAEGEEGDEEVDSEDELAAEAEDLILQAQAHFNSPFPTAHFLAEQSRRPSLPLPAIPLGRRTSAFAEEGLTPLPEDRALEAREGGVVGGASSADEGLTDGGRAQRRKPNKLVKKRRPGAPPPAKRRKARKAPFERFKMPTDEDMLKASECEVVAEDGRALKFGELIKANGQRRTVVIFLRHAWCGLCAQYVEALNRVTVNLVSLETSAFCGIGLDSDRDRSQPTSRIPELNILFINSGSPKLIATYRQRMKTPFPLYSNRGRDLYRALGMTKTTWDMGKDSEKGSYIVKSQLGNVTSSISAGVAMPAYPGSQTQLGGEFVFEHSPEDDSVKCLYASRMHTTRAHAEIEDVFAAAGVELNADDAASVYGH